MREDFLTFISGAVNVVNIKEWSIFMRWNAINIGLEASTLTLTQEGDTYILTPVERLEAEDLSADKSASEAV